MRSQMIERLVGALCTAIACACNCQGEQTTTQPDGIPAGVPPVVIYSTVGLSSNVGDGPIQFAVDRDDNFETRRAFQAAFSIRPVGGGQACSLEFVDGWVRPIRAITIEAHLAKSCTGWQVIEFGNPFPVPVTTPSLFMRSAPEKGIALVRRESGPTLGYVSAYLKDGIWHVSPRFSEELAGKLGVGVVVTIDGTSCPLSENSGLAFSCPAKQEDPVFRLSVASGLRGVGGGEVRLLDGRSTLDMDLRMAERVGGPDGLATGGYWYP